jgi:hypothetical protein
MCRPRYRRRAASLHVRVRNAGPLPIHVAGVDLLARATDGSELGRVETVGPLPDRLEPGRGALVRFRWRAPAEGLAEQEPVLFFACARIAEEDVSPENDCDLSSPPPGWRSQRLVGDSFDEQGPR